MIIDLIMTSIIAFSNCRSGVAIMKFRPGICHYFFKRIKLIKIEDGLEGRINGAAFSFIPTFGKILLDVPNTAHFP